MDTQALMEFADLFLFTEKSHYVTQKNGNTQMFLKYPAIDENNGKELDIDVVTARFSYRKDNFLNEKGFEHVDAIVLKKQKTALVIDASMLIAFDGSFSERYQLENQNLLPANANDYKLFIVSKATIFRAVESWLRPYMIQKAEDDFICDESQKEILEKTMERGRAAVGRAFIRNDVDAKRKSMETSEVVPCRDYGTIFPSELLQDFFYCKEDEDVKKKWADYLLVVADNAKQIQQQMCWLRGFNEEVQRLENESPNSPAKQLREFLIACSNKQNVFVETNLPICGTCTPITGYVSVKELEANIVDGANATITINGLDKKRHIVNVKHIQKAIYRNKVIWSNQ